MFVIGEYTACSNLGGVVIVTVAPVAPPITCALYVTLKLSPAENVKKLAVPVEPFLLIALMGTVRYFVNPGVADAVIGA